MNSSECYIIYPPLQWRIECISSGERNVICQITRRHWYETVDVRRDWLISAAISLFLWCFHTLFAALFKECVLCVCHCFAVGLWAAMKCSLKPRNRTWGMYIYRAEWTFLWLTVELCSPPPCVFALCRTLCQFALERRVGQAVYLGMWNLCVCVWECILLPLAFTGQHRDRI